ncbi:hypothetical protein CLV60_12121 [Dyadobacter jiangsuensis]|uniref:Uncharacterized protein n=1 Tax=Dyadobacter jiangsuensis TaxID=1591085 RepID=A0A2P8FII7_9BACT|nr:hypothetical protein CLV60_12121 [Dyadobacter jiangsuensis]
MEQNGKSGISLQKIVQLYKQEGLEITTEQAALILDFLRRMAKIAVSQVLKRHG